MEEEKSKPSKKSDLFHFFVLPSLANLVAALMGINILGLSGLVTATIFIIVGFILVVTKSPQQGGYMIIAGILAWLVGASVCGIILANF